ncbi:MAG TPA: thiamine phosphate synthase [Gemmatimonadales bacterium]|nr:thiamine phosphate synthase [Gemmatimonadales bacterium]
MTTLPRLLAYADADVVAREDLGRCAAAIAAVGPATALVARWPGGNADQLAALADRFVRLARPTGARVLVTGRADIAVAVGADGVILRRDDLSVADARTIGAPLVFRSVHGIDEARDAVRAGADALVVGTIWATDSHPGRTGAGLALIREVASLGTPVYAIGGVTAERAVEAREAGAHGVAAVKAVWAADDRFKAASALAAQTAR